MAHHRHDHVNVIVDEAEARPDHTDEIHADIGVVPRVSLADVVQQRAEHEEVRSGDAMDKRGRIGRRLPEVPVHGEAVVRVPLRLAADRCPLRQDAHKQVVVVESLEHRDRAVTREQQADEVVNRPRRPRCRQYGR